MIVGAVTYRLRTKYPASFEKCRTATRRCQRTVQAIAAAFVGNAAAAANKRVANLR